MGRVCSVFYLVTRFLEGGAEYSFMYVHGCVGLILIISFFYHSSITAVLPSLAGSGRALDGAKYECRLHVIFNSQKEVRTYLLLHTDSHIRTGMVTPCAKTFRAYKHTSYYRCTGITVPLTRILQLSRPTFNYPGLDVDSSPLTLQAKFIKNRDSGCASVPSRLSNLFI